MPAIYSKAPAKLILLGEHAVVYGYPAIAVPISSLWLKATCQATIRQPSGFTVSAPQLGINSPLDELPIRHPIQSAIALTLQQLNCSEIPSLHLHIHANFPFSSGLGSSAALAVAIIQALSAFLGHSLDLPIVNHLAYLVEMSAHGTPSGVDNSVISYNKPIWFIKDKTPQVLKPGSNFHFVIADTGVKKSTSVTVGELASKRNDEHEKIDLHYEAIGQIVKKGKIAFELGEQIRFGELMNENQLHLEAIGVSSQELDTLISASLKAGALGAKLTGGGRGGFMVALSPSINTQGISQALIDAGAKQVIDIPITPSAGN